jgi:hypothetical protein
MKIFELGNKYQAVCVSEGTRYGFRHVATLLHNGREIAKTKCCYYNRTWESFEFESVLRKLIEGNFDVNKKQKYLKHIGCSW